MTQSEPMTQSDLTQLAVDEDSNLFSPVPPQTPLDPKEQPWGRLVPCSGDKQSGGLDLLPRDPCGVERSVGIKFMGIAWLRPSDIFNEYTLGRSSKCDVQITPPTSNSADEKELELYEWAHAMISNKHCRIFCMLKGPGPLQEMDVYIEDSSGNGTLINGSTLLRRGEKRLLHTGDEICLVNPQTLRKKIRSLDMLHNFQRKYAFIFVNVFQQQQGQNTLIAYLRQKRAMMPPPSSSARRKGLVNPKAMVNHSLDRCAHQRQSPFSHVTTAESKISPSRSNQPRRVEQFYDIREVLGNGTVGEVRRAIHRRTGEECAVKIISLGGRNRGVKLSKEASATLEAEASILQALDHPYIVKLHDVYVAPGVAIYLVMELLHGGDLFDRIVQKGNYSESEARKVMRRLLNAVYYLHEEQNVVHRDLKPENILVVNRQSDIEIKLTDFGLAKSVTEDGLKTFCGTPQYFAPEVLRRRHTVAGRGRYGAYEFACLYHIYKEIFTQNSISGKEADMWSIGVILYILLSGAPPFDVSHGFDEVAEAKIEFPDDRWRGISNQAKNLVKKLLIADPSMRISVKDACTHDWILIEDGDSHTHPLDNPAVPLLNNDERSNLKSVILFEHKKAEPEPRELDSPPHSDMFDDTATCVTNRTEDEVKAPQNLNKCSAEPKTVRESEPMRHGESAFAQSVLPQSQNTEANIETKPSNESPTEDEGRHHEKEQKPLAPLDLNQRSNYFREIVAKSAEKEAMTPRDKSHRHVVLRVDARQKEPEIDACPPRKTVTPTNGVVKTKKTKIYGKQCRTQQGKNAQEEKATELTDDEIVSQFSDEGDSRLSFGGSTVVVTKADVAKTGETAIARGSSTSSAPLSDREDTATEVKISNIPVLPKKRKANIITPQGDSSAVDTHLLEVKGEALTGSHGHQGSAKQTKIFSWFAKKRAS